MSNTAQKIVIVSAKRTPFGSFGGSLKKMTATDLAVSASEATLNALTLNKADIDHVVFGNVIASSKDGIYLARHVALRIGCAVSTPALTLNRLCGSGFEAISDAVRRLRLGEAKLVLAGGTESMSQAPYVVREARSGQKMSHLDLEDSLMTGLFDTFAGIPMAMTAENLAAQYKISKMECDEFALRSQTLTTEGIKNGFYVDEIAPITLNDRGVEKIFSEDEHRRPQTTIETLSKLKPLFKKDGTITAGNASGMVDGASALLITTEQYAKEKNWPILGEWIESSVIGCDPKIMGIGPVPAVKNLFAKTKTSLKDIKYVEINEAFAPQALAVQRELEIPNEKLNPDGGAISIGHPLGASGARLITHLLYRLKKTGGGLGVASACIGGGQGMAVLVKG